MLYLNASEASWKKLKLNCRERTCYNLMRAKRAGKIVKLNCRERSVRNILQEEDRLFISSIFKVRIFISKKCQAPPPSEPNGRPRREGREGGEGKLCRMKKKEK